MINTLIIYYPLISDFMRAGLSPSIKTKVRPSLSTYRAEFSAIITDTSYNMGDHLTKIYLSLAIRYFACWSTCIVLCKIPLFLGHNIYNAKK